MPDTKDSNNITDEAASNDAASTQTIHTESPRSEPSELEDLVAERDKLKDQLLRSIADFDNYRKRSRKDQEEAERRAKEDVLRDVLSLVDNLERAVQAAETATNVQAVADGVRLVLRSFDDTAQRLGLERVHTVGEKFDPSLHDAVQQVETEEHEPGQVITEIVAGYRLSGRLFRPALVVVAKPVAKTE